MKAIFVFLILLIQTAFLFGQTSREINHSDSIRIRKEVESKLQTLKLQLEKSKSYANDPDKEFAIGFILDTFRIEETYSKMMEIDNSDAGMENATNGAEAAYDKLVNKYYKILIGKLDSTDRDILRKAQKNWLRYRDNERELNWLLVKDEYSGGGTIQLLFVYSRILEITKQRLLDIYNYCGRFNN